jgi:hypothetical protein
MHNAPAVSFPVGRSRFQVQILAALAFLGFLAAVVWTAKAQAPDWRQWLMLSGAALTGLGAFWQWHHAPTGQVAWSGSSWHWAESSDAVEARVVVVIDLQRAMLLILGVGGNARKVWLWVERDASPARWLALRRAVYQHPRVEPDALNDATQRRGSKA